MSEAFDLEVWVKPAHPGQMSGTHGAEPVMLKDLLQDPKEGVSFVVIRSYSEGPNDPGRYVADRVPDNILRSVIPKYQKMSDKISAVFGRQDDGTFAEIDRSEFFALALSPAQPVAAGAVPPLERNI